MSKASALALAPSLWPFEVYLWSCSKNTLKTDWTAGRKSEAWRQDAAMVARTWVPISNTASCMSMASVALNKHQTNRVPD